jgi:polysaccharide biosynthesis protein PslE
METSEVHEMTCNLQSPTFARDVCRAVFRHKGKACLFFFVVMTATVVWTLLAPRVYRSEGKLLVRLGRENAALEPTATLGHEQLITVPPSRETEVNSVVEVLASRALAEAAVESIGPESILGGRSWLDAVNPLQAGDDRERAVQQVVKHLEVEPAPKSNVIRISYQAADPRLSQTVVAQLIDSLLRKHVEMNRTKGASEFFVEQAAQLRAELRQKEDQLRALQNETGLISPRSQREALVERLTRLEKDLSATATELAGEEAEVANLHQQRAQLPETQVTDNTVGFSNEGTDFLRDRFYNLKVAEEGARAKYTEDHPKLQEIRQQVAAARALLDKEEPTRQRITTAPSKLREQAEKGLLDDEPRLAALRAKAAALGNELEEVQGELETFNNHQWQIAEVQRDIEIQEAEYRKVSASLVEARIDLALQSQHMSNISVAEEATFSAQPIRPRKLANLLAGLVIGLLGAFALALIADYLDPSLIAPEDLEKKLGLRALTSVPHHESSQPASNGHK